MRNWVQELYKDLYLALVVLGNWVLAGLVADYIAPNDKRTKQALSIWVAVFSVGINGMSFVRSFTLVGSPNAPRETLIGLWAEVLNLTQVWGALFCLTRYFSLDDTHTFFQNGLLNNIGESVWEMGLVQVGAPPYLPYVLYPPLPPLPPPYVVFGKRSLGVHTRASPHHPSPHPSPPLPPHRPA